MFGGPVSAIKLRLRGTHTAVPTGGQAALSVYWNDYLLSSRTLGGDSFDITADIPAGHLQSRNGLRLRLTALPAGGDCTGPAGLLLDVLERAAAALQPLQRWCYTTFAVTEAT